MENLKIGPARKTKGPKGRGTRSHFENRAGAGIHYLLGWSNPKYFPVLRTIQTGMAVNQNTCHYIIFPQWLQEDFLIVSKI